MSLIRFFHSTHIYSFTHFNISSNKILLKSSHLLFRYKSTASINTIIKNSFVKDQDTPWIGEEDIKTTVLRMIVDKYPPLKIKRNSIKEHIDAHYKVINSMAKTNLSPPLPPPIPAPSNKKSIIPGMSKKEKLEKIHETKQSRIMNAKDAAIDYSIKKNVKEEGGSDKQSPIIVPKSITGWNSLVENRIQEAMAAGEFKNLPYHGKPLPTDLNEQNPYLDRTEFFMNRLVKRQGSAPAWIEYQKDVDREIFLFRQRMRESWLRYTNAKKIDPHNRNISWEKGQTAYCEIAISKLNSRLRSYNTIAPYPVRRSYLSLKLEFERTYQDIKKETNYKAKAVSKSEDENKDIYLFKNSCNNDNSKSKEDDDNIWKSFAKSIKWWVDDK